MHRSYLVLGHNILICLVVKNRIELEECILAEKEGNLKTEEIKIIEKLFLS